MQSLLNSVATLTPLLAMVVFGDAYVINGFVRFRCDDNYYNYHGVSSNVTYIIALSNVGSFFAGALLVIAWFKCRKPSKAVVAVNVLRAAQKTPRQRREEGRPDNTVQPQIPYSEAQSGGADMYSVVQNPGFDGSEGAEAPTYEEVADALGQVADDVYEEPSARQSQVYDDSNAANDSEEDINI